MTNRFNQAIDKLVTAFFNETLMKGECDKCAVGNIVGNRYWSDVFLTSLGLQRKKNLNVANSEIVRRGVDHIRKTGYSVDEMARIEFTFEQNTTYTTKCLEEAEISRDDLIQDQFNGLCAVVELLCEMEGITDAQHYKNIFRQKAEVE